MNDKTSSVVVLVIGVGILFVSLFADIIRLGNDPGFGYQQTIGTIAGVVVIAIGLYLMTKKNK